MQNIDYAHLLKVAAMGALSALAIDFVRNNYGDEANAVLIEVQNFLAELLKSSGNTPTQPTI